jgi:hypothetical protein
MWRHRFDHHRPRPAALGCWRRPPDRAARASSLAVAQMIAMAGVSSLGGGGRQMVAAPLPTVFHATESANPGEVIGLEGSTFGSAPQLWLTPVGGGGTAPRPQTALTTLMATDSYVAARIPPNQPMGLYAVWVNNGAGYSRQPAWINRARPTHLEYDQVASGTSLRAFGRNLVMRGALPTVRFVDPSTHASIPAAVDAARSDLYALRFTVPDGLSRGVAYDVDISNGRGGSHGEVTAPERLTLRSRGSDSYRLGVPWAADFSFAGNVYDVTTDPRLTLHAARNGVSSDQGALQGAIDRASADGGGEVYLPAGTYHVGLSRLVMRSRVVLRGDGIDRTTINDTSLSGIDFDPGSSVMGLASLTLRGPTAIHGTNVRLNASSSAPIDRVFLSHVKLQLDVTPSPVVEGSAMHHILVTDSVFEESARQAAPLYWHGSSYLTVRNSSFRFLNARIMLGDSSHILWEGNSSTRDYTLPDQPVPNGDSGHLDLQCTSQVAILGSSFRLVGTNRDSGDGETINTQCGSQPQRSRYWGVATSADATHLVDARQSYSASAHGGLFAVWILRGPGMGQWRWVVSDTPTTLTVDRPWEVVPTSESVYAVREIDAYQFLIKDNTLTDNRFGIEHYTGVQQAAIIHNTLTNDGPIWLRSQVHRQTDVDLSPVWDNYVAENTVSGNDQQQYHTAGMGVIDDEIAGPLVGAMVLGNEFRRNAVHAEVPNLRFPSSGNIQDGYWAWTRDESNSGDMPRDDATMATMGTIFDGNQAFDTANAYWVDTGTYSTVIANYANANSGEAPADLTGEGATHASVNTVVSRGSGPVPPGTAPSPSTGPPASPTQVGAGLPVVGVGAGVSIAVGAGWTWARRRRRSAGILG